jgi:hypothetical protein
MVHTHAQMHVQQPSIPQVFVIGEYEDQYLDLSQTHPAVFMAVYGNDIDKAYQGWSEFLMDMEDYALDQSFDLKGVKLWLNLYFNADGTISNLAFFHKPNSRNVPDDELTVFFQKFVRQYRLPKSFDKGFQHSASASFPTFFHRSSQLTSRNN